MLAADKLLLTSTIRKNATELKGKELALHKARLGRPCIYEIIYMHLREL